MGNAGKTAFELLDFYHERVNKWLQAHADAIAAELAKEEEAFAAADALIRDRLNALPPASSYCPQTTRRSVETERDNLSRSFIEKRQLLKERMREFTSPGDIGLTQRRAGLLVQLSEMTQEGWEIVSCHGSDQVSIGMHSGSSSHNIIILLRRELDA